MRQTLLALCCLIPFQLFSQVTYVDINATGLNNGASWEDAYTDLKLAMNNAAYGDSIWIAKGTYLPTSDNNRHKHFTLKNGVKVFGGFNGTETDFSERNFELYETILDGNIGEESDSTDNAYTVLYIDVGDSTTIVDGMIIQNGYADNEQDSVACESGGGIFVDASFLTETNIRINNCTIQHNFAADWGGGLSSRSNSTLFLVGIQITNCHFYKNIAAKYGGGAIIKAGTISGNKIINTIFEANVMLGQYTSALHLITRSPQPLTPTPVIIKGCHFIDNETMNAQSGTFFCSFSGPYETNALIDSCVFRGNTSANGFHSAINFYSGNDGDSTSVLILQNSIFEDNSAKYSTIEFDLKRHTIIMRNCRFSDNVCDVSGSILSGVGDFKILNCLFENNITEGSNYGFWIASQLEEDSVFISNCTFVGNTSEGPFFRFSSNSVDPHFGPFRIENCIFRGQPYDPWNENGTYFEIGDNIPFDIDNCLIDVPICSSLNDTVINCGPGLIYGEAIFVDSAGDDFRLAPCSPGVNMGNNAVWPSYLSNIDLEGKPRIQEDIIDMGAYELEALALAVDSLSGFICHDDSLGTVSFQTPQNVCEPYTIFGPAGLPIYDLYFENLPAGTHEFILEDALGRSDTLILTLETPDPIAVTAQIDHATNAQSFDGSITVEEITGGIPPYQLLWSLAGDTTYQLQDIGPALYALTVTDSLGCEFIEYYLVEAITKTKEVSIENQILVYPNPFEKEIRIKCPNEINAIEVFDYTGRLMERKSNLNAGEEIRLGTNFLPGVYLIVLYDESGRRYNRRVVKI